jgi:hypothetical protein
MNKRHSIALSLVVFSAVTGCYVPRSRYDQAATRLREEQAARKSAEETLAGTRAELARLQDALATRERALAAREGEAAQSKLDADRLSTERDDATLLVDQLRNELARAGDNLRTFSGQKQELEAALASVEGKSKELDAAERSMERKELLMRDLTFALGPDVTKGSLAITASLGRSVVRIPARSIFEGVKLSSESAGVLDRIAAALVAHSAARVELSDQAADGISPEDSLLRLQQISDFLLSKGIGFERVGIAMSPEGGATAIPASAKVAAKADTWREGPGSIQIAIEE